MRDIRQYETGSWAVRRWDNFNGGRIVEPLSFCQLWRTVILWATLADVPILGGLFLTHLGVRPTSDERAATQAKFDRRLAAIIRVVEPFARFVHSVLFPVRWVFNTTLKVIVNITALIDEADTKGLEKIIGAIFVVIAVAVIGFLLFVIGWGIWVAWQANWVIFLVIASGAPTLLVVSALLTMRFGPAVWGVMVLGWEMAVVSKHRVCPPMTIDRNNS